MAALPSLVACLGADGDADNNRQGLLNGPGGGGAQQAEDRPGSRGQQQEDDAEPAPLECVQGGKVGAIQVAFECDSLDVFSCKDLSNVVLQFADGDEVKFDGLSGTEGTFAGEGEHEGDTIVGVWVKAGNNKSGGGPGYGERFDAPGDQCDDDEPPTCESEDCGEEPHDYPESGEHAGHGSTGGYAGDGSTGGDSTGGDSTGGDSTGGDSTGGDSTGGGFEGGDVELI